jgi:hypothetical protein
MQTRFWRRFRRFKALKMDLEGLQSRKAVATPDSEFRPEIAALLGDD